MLLGIVDLLGGGWDPPVRSEGCSVGPCGLLVQPDPLQYPDPAPTHTACLLVLRMVAVACSLSSMASCYSVIKKVQPPNFTPEF